mmetsp:Transcript_76817/g.215937  ORF Transcript_76817/g.215937 Transcript_76817/m.215937 type:complete len:208 (-) Transcript_76817:654-1277(-)
MLQLPPPPPPPPLSLGTSGRPRSPLRPSRRRPTRWPLTPWRWRLWLRMRMQIRRMRRRRLRTCVSLRARLLLLSPQRGHQLPMRGHAALLWRHQLPMRGRAVPFLPAAAGTTKTTKPPMTPPPSPTPLPLAWLRPLRRRRSRGSTSGPGGPTTKSQRRERCLRTCGCTEACTFRSRWIWPCIVAKCHIRWACTFPWPGRVATCRGSG